jgi:hypothetical protein
MVKESNSETLSKPVRKPIFGCLSWVVFVSGFGWCRYLVVFVPGPHGPDNLGYRELLGALGFILSSIFAIVGLTRDERPRWPSIWALLLTWPPALLGLFMLLRALWLAAREKLALVSIAIFTSFLLLAPPLDAGQPGCKRQRGPLRSREELARRAADLATQGVCGESLIRRRAGAKRVPPAR